MVLSFQAFLKKNELKYCIDYLCVKLFYLRLKINLIMAQKNRLKSQEIDIHFGFHVDLLECHLQSEKISPIKWV